MVHGTTRAPWTSAMSPRSLQDQEVPPSFLAAEERWFSAYRRDLIRPRRASPKDRGEKNKLHRSPKPSGPLAWCADDIETLPNGLCHIDGGQRDGERRTLVVFLHGAIAKDVDWQWLQAHALKRQAKQNKFE